MSRVDASRIAVWKAHEAGLSLKGSAVCSDAFFPFPDGLIAAADAGATCVIQPGGSVRDDEVIAAADERGLAMAFTGVRHFRHYCQRTVMGHSPHGLALPDKRKTSIWLALKNPVFKGYWLAALVSGTCVAAHNTAAFSVLGQESDSAILISLMSTLSSLPFALFTLPAGALADMAERKKILYGTSLWQASIALCLAILALTDSAQSVHHPDERIPVRNRVCLCLPGICFGRSGDGSTRAFGFRQHAWGLANEHRRNHRSSHWRFSRVGLGTGQRIRRQRAGFSVAALGDLALEKTGTAKQKLTPEDFFATIETAIRYVRYTPGIKVILARIALFSFFISIIPALMPVVGLKELHLDPSQLGYPFHRHGDRVGRRSGLHHAASAGAPFAK